MDWLYFVFVILGFFAAVMFLEGLYLAWSAYMGEEARLIARRLRVMSGERTQIETASLVKKRMLSDVPAIDEMLSRLPKVQSLDAFLAQSGTSVNVASFLGIGLLLFLGGLLVPTIFGMPLLISLILAAALLLLWVGYIHRLRSKRVFMIEQQLPDALELMARAMLAGHAFSSALLIVGTEGPQPIAQEFKTAFDEINYGVSTETALQNLAARVASSDMRFFVVAVLIQSETGGNLADILKSISKLIRERQKLVWQVRVLTAEGRLSAQILTGLPFVLAAVLSIVNRQFISKLWTEPMGLRLVAFALTLMVIGVWWMWRMVKIRI
ncbi:MAG TPA: type II secretion system F family protein [Aquabacterium sp.]|uniref:type II secretion system F family protein n=1 Tax=Aquabacterium sp. TaxID=1872578 RepID=UPI002E319E96|nr:type II secretion system F family protein [Aquabacterium sp.]HEX5372290.1 type II secretion system F family protein [Aquabacterium sp.]